MENKNGIYINFSVESMADENQMKKAIDWINDLGYSIKDNPYTHPKMLEPFVSCNSFSLLSDVISVAANVVTIIVGLKVILGKSHTSTSITIDSSHKTDKISKKIHISMIIDSTENISEQVKQILDGFDRGCL